jgi:Na+-transporting methylmalonyl-CoA/oxaloacetate decarboxylase gamma subunit
LPKTVRNKGVTRDMGIDWGQAFYIGGAGFGTVLLVLAALAGVILLVARAIRRIGHARDKADITQKGD